ncbi:ion channel [Anaeromyxobacter paludicola]|uniref:Inward rectifier potassium channel protein n=1 Tax=Anaeromyxobacter paludicola TaxID=2918171 RepID=A0ABM7XDE6_9BACT|nr:ion channel [Anaeromyxobacter paludicola]BDG09905.1 inward rectifier potassium channel protein [Anaeromyxobacter paludicola]
MRRERTTPIGDRVGRMRSEYGAGREIEVLGIPRHPFLDAYHHLLTASWPRLISLALAVFLGANGLFAVGYFTCGGVEGARPGSFRDAFFFSIQTMATIGYGRMSPVSLGAHVLVALEAFSGLFALAFMTSLFFAKFARPSARVLFSEVVVVSDYDGVPSLMLRMANARANQIVEAQVHLSLVRDEVTAEGQRVRRVRDLALRRSQSPMFAISWTAIHPIDPGSPFYGSSAELCRESETDLIVTLIGFDESLSQTVHARHSYRPEAILFGRRFVDLFAFGESGVRTIDYRRFHDTEPGTLSWPSPGSTG